MASNGNTRMNDLPRGVGKLLGWPTSPPRKTHGRARLEPREWMGACLRLARQGTLKQGLVALLIGLMVRPSQAMEVPQVFGRTPAAVWPQAPLAVEPGSAMPFHGEGVEQGKELREPQPPTTAGEQPPILQIQTPANSVHTPDRGAMFGEAPAIITPPATLTVTFPAQGIFTVVATGDPTPTYQWQKSTDGGTTWGDVSGAKAATLTTPATTLADSGAKYRVVATNGIGTAATSAEATLTVVAPLPVIAYSPSSQTLNLGVAMTPWTPTNTGGAATGWTISPALPAGLSLNATTGAILGTPTADQVLTTHTVTASNSGGSATATINLTVQTPPVPGAPAPATVVAGSNATFSTSATGTGPFTYQWQRSDDNVTGVTDMGFGLGDGTKTTFQIARTRKVNSDWGGTWPEYSKPRTNLVKHSQDFSQSTWSTSTLQVTADNVMAPDGTMTADTLTAPTSGTYSVSNTMVASAPALTSSVYVKKGTLTNGIFALRNETTATTLSFGYFNFETGVISGSGWTATALGNGWVRLQYRCRAGISVGDTLRFYPGITGNPLNAGDSWVVWGAQVEPLEPGIPTPSRYIPTGASAVTMNPDFTGAHWEPLSNFPPTAAVSLPAAQLWNTGAAPRAPYSHPRTNLLKQTSQFEGSSWYKFNVTATANNAVAPDGSLTADTLSYAASGATVMNQSVVAPSTTVTYSIYTKQGTRSTGVFLLRNSTTATNFDGCTFNYATGTLAGVGWSVTPLPNGWYRLQYTRSTGITIGDTLACYTCTTGQSLNAGDSWLLWGAQLEAGPVASEPIPNEGFVAELPAEYAGNPTLYLQDWQGKRRLYSTPRTNLATQSQDLNTWVLAGGTTVTPNTTAAPDGTLTADTVTFKGVGYGFAISSAIASPGRPTHRTLSIWAKGAVGGEVITVCDGWVSGPTVTLTTAWQRLVFTTVTPRQGIALYVWALSGTPTVHLWGAQHEELPQGSAPTAYIPTTTAAVTRTDCTLSGGQVTLAVPPAAGSVLSWLGASPVAGGAPTNWMNLPGATSATYTTPTTEGDQGAQFRVVVSGPGGTTPSDPATLTVTAPVPAFGYHPATRSLPLDQVFVWAPISTGGSATTWTISPALPAGLSFNTSNGTLSGTPTALATSAIYTVTATNAAGSASATLELAVTHLKPNFSYTPTPRTLTAGTAVTWNPIIYGGPSTTWSIDKALPAGLNFNATTGAITGTPTVASAATTYSVTASNTGGSYSATFNLTVVLPALPVIAYSPTSRTLDVGVAMTPWTPTSTGGAVATWSVGTALPAGLSLNATTGSITGTPTLGQNPTSYTITATNLGGSATFQITLGILAPPILPAPANATVVPGANASFTVTPTGVGPFTYQWQRSDDNVAGVTDMGFGLGDGTKTTFQIARTRKVNSDWGGTWPEYSKPRTNLVMYSQDFDNAAWTRSKSGTGALPVVVPNNATAPDGTQTADTVTLDAGAGTTASDWSILNQRPANVTKVGESYTVSLWVKGAPGQKLLLRGVGHSAYLEMVANGEWQRFSKTEAAIDTNAEFSITLRQGFVGNLTPVTVQVWGAQIEAVQAGIPTTSRYIPTGASAVTVNPDFTGAHLEPLSNFPAAAAVSPPAARPRTPRMAPRPMARRGPTCSPMPS